MNKILIKEVYESIPYGRVASLISESHPEIKISDSLIRNYIALAESEQFNLDPVIYGVRKLNKFSLPENGYINFSLSNGTKIVIKESTLQRISEYSQRVDGLESFIGESKENFIKILNLLQKSLSD